MRVVWQEATGVVIALAILQACASEGHAKEQVPTDVPVLSLISTCIETSGRPVSMSPEGDLWFATEDGLRIVQSSGAETTLSLDLGETSHAQAWSDSQLTLSALGELWQVRDQKLVFVPSPEEVGAISAFCSDPARPNGAFVISDKGLFQRIGDAWWQWSQHDESSFGRIDYLLRSDGACMSEDGALWFVNDDNEIWRVSETNASVVATLPDSAGALLSVPGLGLVTMLDGDLRVGQDWRSIGFDAGAVQSIRLGGEHLWVGVGDDVYVYWSGAWQRLETDANGPILSVWAHSGAGAWLDMGTQFCHVDAGRSVRIRGLRPFERRKLATANLEIELDTENLVVHLDGQTVQNLSVIAPGQFVLSDVGLGDSGWHKLELFDDDQLARALRYFIIDTPQVSWQADLAPVFAASCAGELCHGPAPKGSRIDLSTYESWKTRAGLIRRRLLLGEMPIGDSLPHETIKRVSQWVEGGMLP